MNQLRATARCSVLTLSFLILALTGCGGSIIGGHSGQGGTAQTITFANPGTQIIGTAAPALAATATSGLPVTLASMTASTCSVNGTAVTLLVIGTCSIQATQPGNNTYAAAAPVTQSFTINGEPQTITFAPIASQTISATPTLTLPAPTATSGLPVTLASITTSTCSVSGTAVTLLTSGTCSIQATQPGNTIWAAAAPVTQSFTINGRPQTITFAAIANQTLATTPTLTLPTPTATSGLPVALASTTTSVCSVNGTTVTLLATGTCSIQATQPGNSAWAAASPVTQSFTILGGGQTQTITFNNPGTQTVGAPLTLVATASSGLPVSFASQTASICTVSGTTATFLIAGTCTIQATQAGNATYAAATPVSQSFTVNAGSLLSQTITFNNPGSQIVGTPLTLVATASSGLPVSFTSLSTSVCTVSGTTATFIAVGTCTIQATQPGNAVYAPATPVSQSFQVNSATCSLGSSYNFPTGPTYTTKSGSATLSRTIPWAPGISGGVPQRTAICKTLSATGNGDDAAINSALANCADNGVVLLNPGNYNIKNAVIWSKNNVVLRGSGGPGVAAAQQTRLMADPSLYGPVVNIGLNLFPHPTAAGVNLTADALQGTNTATVTSTSSFKVGDLVTVDMLVDPADDTGAWIVNAPAGGTGLVYPYSEYNPDNSPHGDASRGWFSRDNRPTAQIMEIQSISGNTITFSSPFHMTFDVAHTAQITDWDTTPLTNSGLEDVYVSGVPAPGGNVQYNDVVLTMAKYSWVKNIETDNSNGYGIGIDQSFRCIVRDSYIHSTINPTPGGAGYGLEFSSGSADNLAENNISWNFDKVMVMRASGGGNVMAYNYMDDGWIAYQPNWVESGINAAHMTTPHFELFEGNLSFALGTDDTWGGTTFITWLRNVATNHRSAWPPLNTYLFNSVAQSQGGCTSTGPLDNNCIPYTDAGNRASAEAVYGDEFFNYVGNVLGSIGMPIAPESNGFAYANTAPDWTSDPVPMWIVGFGDWNGNSALDQGVANTIYRDGNYDYATNSVKWAGSPQTIPNSLYSCSKPGFFGSYAWPWSDGSSATTPYQTHSFMEYPLSTKLGTFGTSGTKVSYPGYQLPAFVRFLELHGIEQPPADCASAALAGMPADCSLLFTGNVSSASLQSQTITFANPGTQRVGTPLTLVATASSGLPVSFASQTTSVCTVSGITATFLTAGTCTIQATQAGNATYAAATPVTQGFTINTTLLAQTITFNDPGDQAVGTPLTLVATASSGLPVSFASQTTGVCTVSGTTATFLAAGTCTIQATQAGDSTYAAAAPVSQSFVVNAAAASASNYLGINIGTDLDWDTGRMFADVIKSSRSWASPSNAGNVLPISALDANGWPAQDASLYVWAGIDKMQGTYALSFNGQATVQASSGSITNTVYNSSSNLTTATLSYAASDSNYLTLTFANTRRTSSSSTDSGVTNVVLMRPSAVGGATPLAFTQVFNPPFLAALSDFAVLRTMDFSATNGNEIVNWNDRTRPGDASQAIGNPGAPAGGWEGPGGAWEYAIVLANTTGKDLWVNVPLNANDDYINKLAQLLMYGSDGTVPYTSAQSSPVWPPLNPGLKVYIEFANEVWNTGGGFPGNENHDEAVAEVNAGNSPLNFDGDTNNWNWAWRRTAKQTVDISTIFRSVVGDANMMTRFRPVLMSQLGYADGPLLQEMHLMVDYYDNPAQVASPHPPGYYIYGLGGSGYYNPTDKSSVNSIFSTMATGFASAVQGDVDYALPFGVRRIAYEGGPSMDSTGNTSQDANQAAAWADPRMEQVIVTQQNAWNRANGDLLVYFELAGGYQWGFMSDVLTPASPKMSGIADILASPKSASTYGTPIPANLAASSANVPPAWLWSDSKMHDYKWTSFSVLASTQQAFTVTLSVDSSSSGAQAEVFVDGTSIGTVAAPGSGNSAALVTPALAVGSHGIMVRSVSGSFNLDQVNVQAVP